MYYIAKLCFTFALWCIILLLSTSQLPERGQLMRTNLRQARLAKQLTVEQIAAELNISINSYKNIEWGYRNTKTYNWDKLEDLLQVPQRQLRENITSTK